MKVNGKVVQFHHVLYRHLKPGNKRESQREVILPVYMAQHRLISLIQRLKPENICIEFWQALRVLDAAYSPLAHSLSEKIQEAAGDTK